MVLQNAPSPDVYIDILIFLLWSLCKIILVNVQDVPNAPHLARLCHIGHGFSPIFSLIIELKNKNMPLSNATL